MLIEGYELDAFAKMLGGRIIQRSAPDTIRYLVTDSRHFQTRKGAVFVAITGQQHNGHKYLKDAYQKGIRNFVVSQTEFLGDLPDSNVIEVSDALAALQRLATAHRNQFDYPVIAVTGSNGKTIVKEWLAQLLGDRFNIMRSPKSYNSQIGVPLSVWRMQAAHTLGILEAGISLPGEMEKLEKIIHPTIGIFTNIGPPHQENFTDFHEKTIEKLCLFPNAKILIYCKDHKIVHDEASRLFGESQTKLLTWSRTGPADLVISREVSSIDSTLLGGEFQGAYREIEIPFTDVASIENACHCWLTLLHLGLSDQEIAVRMKGLTAVAMRLEQLAGINGCVIVNDVYNSDFASLEIALDHLQKHRKNKKSVFILSDILQSGERPEELYGRVADLIRYAAIDRFIGIGADLSTHAGLFEKTPSAFFPTTEAFLDAFRKDHFREENILIKGARPFAFERISERLEEKTHETILQIDLTRMKANLNYVRSQLDENTRLMVMVKAFAYGSGSYEIARFLELNRADYLAVAYADEGVELRQSGIELPILVLNPEISSYDAMIRYRLEPQIFSFRTLDKFLEAVNKSAFDGEYPVHLKLNTGMNRLGFNADEIILLAQRLNAIDRLHVVSVFSHLASSENAELDGPTARQIALFRKLTTILKDALPSPFLRHILNSNGILLHPKAQFEMVRLGIALHGLSSDANSQKKLQPVSRMTSTISQLREVKAGESVGYSPKKVFTETAQIAILPVGYADGVPRLLGNGVGKVWIAGKKAPFAGNICMDMSMVDVTGIDCKEGDEVEIFGDNLSIMELATDLQTIPYEILTNISQRVKRVFHQE